ncbi:ABC transporter permease (plasmid) [Paracoccus versutus]|uniref:ABC transport system permease protein n=1 Tax=Paracoccus versutus TaxID=34007 RepID=A0A099FJF2_PARVE|nr:MULTISPECIES: ABC transporter permease [Paracoccus]SFX12678.1 putative ABC transport system permease protein [Paracoccus pantotrophus]KGJ10147.1 hypothetical protein IT40_13630 [Paracoccus versutus]MBT0781128.1 ABC transporter permease [Paracoccus sp. pheM1]MCJ1902137.1 ABC transporter permease [Paracoccus versutus]MDF3906839.1 ABC transporter permease [Paracoccus sp. AS002]
MSVLTLGSGEIAIAGGLISCSAGLSLALHMGIGRRLAWAALRMSLQLLAVGYLLRLLFRSENGLLVGLVMVVMLAAAAHEIGARQSGPRRWSEFLRNLLILCISAAGVALLGLTGLSRSGPAFDAQHVIPVFGIILGTAMNSAALTLHALKSQIAGARNRIEAQLALGRDMGEATRDLSRSAIVSGTIPIINQMAGAGIITLPGIMSGQVLAGQDPTQAAIYQIFLMALLALASVVCVALTGWLFIRSITDDRQRLRLDRLGS